jgi:hypothetical protein
METSGEVKQEALGVVGAAAESTVGRHEYNIRKNSLRNQRHQQK